MGTERAGERVNCAHVASRLFNTPLLITRAKLDVILAALLPRITGRDASKPEVLLASSPTYGKVATLEGGVAVIPVEPNTQKRGIPTAASAVVSFGTAERTRVVAFDHRRARRDRAAAFFDERFHNKATVALANKLARIVWAVWRTGTDFSEKGAAISSSI
jgi:hypothetical protein